MKRNVTTEAARRQCSLATHSHCRETHTAAMTHATRHDHHLSFIPDSKCNPSRERRRVFPILSPSQMVLSLSLDESPVFRLVPLLSVSSHVSLPLPSNTDLLHSFSSKDIKEREKDHFSLHPFQNRTSGVALFAFFLSLTHSFFFLCLPLLPYMSIDRKKEGERERVTSCIY